jgi:hypothetical protein
MGEDYGYAEQTISAFAGRHRDEVEAKKRDLSSEFGHIWWLFTVECGAPLRQWVYAARRAALVSRIRAW